MLDKLLSKHILGNTVLDYLIFLGMLIIGILVIIVIKTVIFERLKRIAGKTKTPLDEFLVNKIQKSLIPLLYYGAFFLATRGLYLHKTIDRILNVVGIALITFMAVRFLLGSIEFILRHVWMKEAPKEKRERNIRAILPLIKVIIWGLGIVFLLDNLGFEITTVIAGLGIGGVAVALAAQAVLGDLFSYFAILFDRPFEVGDFIIIGDFMGNVEYVGVKTTRIRSLGGEQLVFSNTDLTGSRLRNYKRMERRRVVFKLGVTYDTTLEKLKEIPDIIKTAITGISDTQFDRAHFSSYGDFSLIFEVVYYVLSSDYNKYMDIQQEINLTIAEEFQKRAIEFAFPTQTLYINKLQ